MACQPKRLLHVGCGPQNTNALPALFQSEEWQEVRLDINPGVQPDIIGTITDMSGVDTESYDAVYSSHNLEHLYSHQVPAALREFHRVLHRGGFALLTVPDIQAVAREIANGKLEEVMYVSPAGPISAIDIMWGHRRAIEHGNEFMAHRTGFTQRTLETKLQQAGFVDITIKKLGLNLWAQGFRSPRGH